MQVQYTPYHAHMIAQNVDYNYNGVIENKELSFRNNSRQRVDYNRDGRVTKDELAWSLQRGDIYITSDRKAYPAYYGNPGYGYGNPGYGMPMPYPHPGYGYPMQPHLPPLPQAPGYPYQSYRPQHQSGSNVVAGTLVGAGIGAGVGYVVGGSQGAGTGAAIGGALGLISQLFE